ncbi:MAG: hypothetical protein WD360_03155 [Nitriliruptoraceae bacterium]
MSSDTAEMPQRDIKLLIAAIVVAAAVIAAVFLFGVERPPQLTELAADQTGLPAVPIAWTSWSRDELCVYIAEIDGSWREVRCGVDGELVGFETDGPLQLFQYGRGMSQQFTLLSIAPDTGEITATQSTNQEIVYDDPSGLMWFRDGDELVVRYDNTDVWRVESQSHYTIFAGRVSPDGQHIAMTDSAQRIVLLSVSGEQPARVWVPAGQARNQYGPNALLWEGESVLQEPQAPRVP